jgi:hypothetical protein
VALLFGSGIESRLYLEAIAITHILTLGFFTHVMFGSLFQMVPVIIAVPYKNVEFRAKMILITLNIGIFSFVLSFLFNLKVLSHVAMLFLGVTLIYFAIYSFLTVIKTVDKNATAKTFLFAFIFLALGTVLAILAILEYDGLFGGIRFGDIHLSFMFFGWLFMLVSGVSYKVIPMFYVAKEYPSFMKNYFYIIVSFLLLLILISTVLDYQEVLKYLKVSLSFATILFALTTIKILKNRKRARGETTINLWYFSMVNLAFGSIIWIVSILFEKDLDILLGAVFGIGFAFAIINAMLYKIVPFLTWFHLSSKLIFDAEMSQVIKTKYMKLQANIFMSSYIFFILAFYVKPFLYIATTLFFVSAIILLKNIIGGYKYHVKMIK